MVHGKKERNKRIRIIIIIIRRRYGAKTKSLQTLLGRLNKHNNLPQRKAEISYINVDNF
jgi:predicted transcriptional regulator